MNIKQKKLFEFLQPAVQALGFEIYWIEYGMYTGGNVNLRIYIDKDGLTSADCANISRYIKTELDVSNILSDKYQLEISSPGIDKPLFTLGHFKSAIGCEVEVKTLSAINGVRNFIGKIDHVDDDCVLLKIDRNDEIVKIDFNNIQKANIKIDTNTLFKTHRN